MNTHQLLVNYIQSEDLTSASLSYVTSLRILLLPTILP